MIWLPLLLDYAGLAAFAFSMQVHRDAVFGQRSKLSAGKSTALRLLGSGLLGLALINAVSGHGVGAGTVFWFVGAGACGFALTLVLAFHPRWWPLPGLALFIPLFFS